MRAAVISKAIERLGVAFSAVEVERCAMRLIGYRYDDMIDMVGLLEWTVRKLVNRSTKVSRWRRNADAEGRTVLTRPALGDTADFVCSCEGLSEKSRVSLGSEAISADQLNALVTLCLTTSKYKIVPQSEIDMHQRNIVELNGPEL